MQTFDLEHRVVLITGGSGGIGRACAVEFHHAGCRVAVVARTAGKLEELRATLGEDRVEAVCADVTDPNQRSRAVAAVRARFGAIDVLVNNAGWAGYGPLASLPYEYGRRMLATNFEAPLALIQSVLPDMLARRSGQIVNISSVVAIQPMPRMAVYSATKAALTALSTSLRLELRGSGVDCILVSPGSTKTGFFDAAAQIQTQAVRYSRFQQSPEHVARAVVRACRRRKREVTLSPEGKLIALIRRFSHRFADGIVARVGERTMPGVQRTDSQIGTA